MDRWSLKAYLEAVYLSSCRRFWNRCGSTIIQQGSNAWSHSYKRCQCNAAWEGSSYEIREIYLEKDKNILYTSALKRLVSGFHVFCEKAKMYLDWLQAWLASCDPAVHQKSQCLLAWWSTRLLSQNIRWKSCMMRCNAKNSWVKTEKIPWHVECLTAILRALRIYQNPTHPLYVESSFSKGP